MVYQGWSEPAATNAPVADEPVEAVFRMNENPSSVLAYIYFFHLFSTPKFSRLLPTTYQPLPPHSIARARETSSGSELGAGELGAGAWSRGAAGVGAGPTQDSGKHFTFFSLVYFLCLFVELRCTRYAAQQRSSTSRV